MARIVVYLVPKQQNRRFHPAQQLSDLRIRSGDSCDSVQNKQDYVCLRYCGLHLFSNECGVAFGRSRYQPTRVDERKLTVSIGYLGLEPVACGTGNVLHYRGTPANKTVEKRRLPDVWTPDDNDNRFTNDAVARSLNLIPAGHGLFVL